MNQNQPDWKRVGEETNAILDEHAEILGQETVDAVRHYLAHDEYEMAVEGLCLDLLQRSPRSVDWKQCLSLARLVGLDQESVFDADFWDKLSTKAS